MFIHLNPTMVEAQPILGNRDPLMEAMEFIQDLESDKYGGHLSIQQTSTLMGTLWERSGCTEILGDKCNDCLSVETLFEIIEANNSEGLTDATYPRASVVLTYFLYSFTDVCQTAPTVHNYTWYLAEVMSASGWKASSNVRYINQEINPDSEVYLTEDGLSSILKLINKTYAPLSKVKCFYANTLFQDAAVDVNPGADESQTQSICAHMISNLLQGDLIGESMYIKPNAFIDEIYSDYGEGEKITPEGFEEIMTSLGIGSHSHTTEMEETMNQLDETHSYVPTTIHEAS
ncbi:uncharacterized protein LOC117120381 [Anneissia japonica]|uniref:uncharacterized protein LOC117120381 n=1 Tax=Anneissia japonica TaxID=1529436 RepID=UPI001425AC0D|nr:uncharacterized protein LOC117120381 [Anneissia japonica]